MVGDARGGLWGTQLWLPRLATAARRKGRPARLQYYTECQLVLNSASTSNQKRPDQLGTGRGILCPREMDVSSCTRTVYAGNGGMQVVRRCYRYFLYQKAQTVSGTDRWAFAPPISRAKEGSLHRNRRKVRELPHGKARQATAHSSQEGSDENYSRKAQQ